MENREERKKRLRERLAESIDYATEKTDAQIQELIDELLTRESKTAPLSLKEREQLRRELFHAIRKLDVLQDLVDDTHITENAHDQRAGSYISGKGRAAVSERT